MLINGNKEWLENLIDKFKKLKGLVYQSDKQIIIKVQKVEFTKEEFRAIYLDDMAYFAYFDQVDPSVVKFVFEFWLNKYSDCAKEILEKSPFDELKVWVLESGYCFDLSIYDDLVYSDDFYVRIFAVKKCTPEKLYELINDEDSRIRERVYERLGPKACIDKMLEDKDYECRLKGVQLAPYGYPKLEDLIDDSSKYVFKEVAKKIDGDLLPFLLRSKHIEDPKVLELIDRRLNGEIIIDTFNKLMEKK